MTFPSFYRGFWFPPTLPKSRLRPLPVSSAGFCENAQMRYFYPCRRMPGQGKGPGGEALLLLAGALEFV